MVAISSTPEVITAVIDGTGQLTGQFQRGDWSMHRDFDPAKHKVMPKYEFDKAIAKLNKAITKKNQMAGIISMNELYPRGIENSLWGVGDRADNFWKE